MSQTRLLTKMSDRLNQQPHTRSELQLGLATMMNHPGFFDPRLLAAAKARGARKESEAKEVASFLLQLKHRSSGPEAALTSTEQLLALRQAQQAARMRDPLAFPNVGAVGAVYGYPTASFKPFMGAERAPALLEEPVISEMSWDALLGDTNLVQMKDRDLVPDALFVAMAQMKPCKLTQADRVGCYKTRELGFTGMCCKHCGGQPGFGRYYPNSVRSLAQTTTSQTILKHIGSKCRFCPPHVRQALLELQRAQAAKEGIASGRPRYGSRKIFFQRMWARLHGKREVDEEDEDDSKAAEDASRVSGSAADSEDESSLAAQDRKRNAQEAGQEDRDDEGERESKKQRVVGL